MKLLNNDMEFMSGHVPMKHPIQSSILGATRLIWGLSQHRGMSPVLIEPEKKCTTCVANGPSVAMPKKKTPQKKPIPGPRTSWFLIFMYINFFGKPLKMNGWVPIIPLEVWFRFFSFLFMGPMAVGEPAGKIFTPQRCDPPEDRNWPP